VLVDATVIAIKRLQERSQEPDMDETIYQNFKSSSPYETKLTCGHIFQVFASDKKYSSQSIVDTPKMSGVIETEKRQSDSVNSARRNSNNSLGDRLYVGMTYKEIIKLLGEPSKVNPGTEMLETGPRGVVVASEKTRAQLSHTMYCMWKRPEGIYALTIVDGKLASIYEKP